MIVEKVNYICVDSEYLGEEQNKMQAIQQNLSRIMMQMGHLMDDNLGWLRLKYEKPEQNRLFYYNRNVRCLFPDLSDEEYTRPLFNINKVWDMNQIFSSGMPLAEMRTSLIRKEELLAAFQSKNQLQRIAKRWNWSEGLLSQYFAVLPCELGSEVCRIDGKRPAFWGEQTIEKACLIIVAHLANYVSGGNWQDDVLYLMKKHIFPVFESAESKQDTQFLAEYSSLIEKKQETFQFEWDMLQEFERAKAAKDSSARKILKLEDLQQKQEVINALLECDYKRVMLSKYDRGRLNPLNGHWDLWDFVQYNNRQDDLPQPPAGKVWIDVSSENIYARNPADDMSPTAETVAIDFGTKSTTVARMDNQDNIVTVAIGAVPAQKNTNQNDPAKNANDEMAYENPTILKYIDLDSFRKAYDSVDGRPETKFDDLSASHVAEQQFEAQDISTINDILAYQYQIKQWAYDNNFASLIFDRHHPIQLKPYKDIGEGDFDPIEAYAYLVGLTLINMHQGNISTRYVLSYPPSYGADICKKIEMSFKRGIRKAVPVQAQQSNNFNHFSVLLGQSEPAAYAVCAIKEFAIGGQYKKALCGVYDLGGGTVDYHFGVFTGGNTPYEYESIQNGGNPRLGCENILEELAYHVFSFMKDELPKRSITYQFPKQYSRNLQDLRHTSDSTIARRNTLRMISALREVWIHNFEPIKEDRLCYFEVYSDTDSPESCYLEIESDSSVKEPKVTDTKSELKLSLNPEVLRKFFQERLESTIWEFLEMQEHIQKNDPTMPCVIFLAGNGAKAPMVKEIFQRYINERNMNHCKLYPPLGTKEAEELGQNTSGRVGSIPNAKTGVAHGLLIALPHSDFIVVKETHQQFIFRYNLGFSRYDQSLQARVFCLQKRAGSFTLFKKGAELAPENFTDSFDIFEDGYLQIWYTDSTLPNDVTLIKECGAKQFLIQVPDTFLSEVYDGIRGACYCQAVSETELELFIVPTNKEMYYPYGILNLETGLFDAYSYDTKEQEVQ